VAVAALLLSLGTLAAAEDPAPAETGGWTAEQLKELVGPVALYPDVVLTSLLPASAYPDEVLAASQWLATQPASDTPPTAPSNVTWDKSVQALVQFPDVLAWLGENYDWMKQLGDAVATQQADVLAAIQTFRKDAQAAGNLESGDQITVTSEPAEGGGSTEVIVIESSDPGVVYVPTYDPVAVVSPGYTGWSFAAGVAVGAAGAWAWNNIDWGNGWNGGGDINISNDVNISGGDRYGPNRPSDWKPPARDRSNAARDRTPVKPKGSPGSRGPGAGAGARPGGGPGAGTRPGGPGGGPGAGTRPGAGAGGVQRPTTAPRVPGMQPGAGGGARPGGGAAGARPGGGATGAGRSNPPSHAFGGSGNAASTRAASDRGGSSMRSGGGSSKGYSGRSGGGGGGGRSGGGGGGRGGGGGGRRR
jgi:hypothetical protein